MKLTAALLVVLVALPVFGQNTPPPQALTYPRRPPKEWTAEFKDMKKRMDRARARQSKTDQQNRDDLAMINLEQSQLQGQIPQGAGYDEPLDLWIPQAPTTPPPAPKAETKPEPAPEPVKPEVVPPAAPAPAPAE